MVSKLAEHYVRLGMTNETRQAVEQWRADNRDPDSGKVVSFSEALRRLIDAGLSDAATKRTITQAKSRKGE